MLLQKRLARKRINSEYSDVNLFNRYLSYVYSDHFLIHQFILVPSNLKSDYEISTQLIQIILRKHNFFI